MNTLIHYYLYILFIPIKISYQTNQKILNSLKFILIIRYICIRFTCIVAFHISLSLNWYWIKEMYLCKCKWSSWCNSQQREVSLLEVPRPARRLRPASYTDWVLRVKLVYTFNPHTLCFNFVHWGNHRHMTARTERDHENDRIILPVSGATSLSSLHHHTWQFPPIHTLVSFL
jgi:hypothetical protein